MGERIYEASGRGRENFQVVHGIMLFAKFTMATNGVTVSNVVGGIGFSATATDSLTASAAFSFSPRFGTVPPNFWANVASAGSAAAVNINGVGSGSFILTPFINGVLMTGAQTVAGTIFGIGYSQTGTAFS